MNAALKFLILKSLIKNRHLALKIFVFAEPQWAYKILCNHRGYKIPHKIYLLENMNVTVKVKHFINNVRRDGVSVLKFIYSRLELKNKHLNIFKPKNRIFIEVASAANLNNLKYLISLSENKPDFHAFAEITQKGRLDMVRFLYEKYDFRYIFDNRIFSAAAESGNVNLLKYLYTQAKKIKKLDSLFMDSFNAFKSAAAYGYLHIVKYLYSITKNLDRIEEIFADDFHVFKLTASYGHTKILQYLYSKCRLLKCVHKIFTDNFNAFESAIESNRFRAAVYLYRLACVHNHRDLIFSSDFRIFKTAVEEENKDILKFYLIVAPEKRKFFKKYIFDNSNLYVK